MGAGAGGWLGGFRSIVKLELDDQRTHAHESEVSLLPLHGFSPALKSLRVQFMIIPSSRIFDLMLSFPLLGTLAVVALDTSIDNGDGSNGLSTVIQRSNPPTFTGSLELFMRGGMEHIARRLLSLPGGINFRKLTLTWFHERDLSLTMALVERCSCTLESLDITCSPLGTFIRCPPSLALTTISSRVWTSFD